MTIKLACVMFKGERERHVIPVPDIRNFRPKGITDFIPEKLYSIVWPVLKRQDSDTTEKLYEGKILLLAANPESMVKQAKSAGIKLPPAFLNSVLGKSEKPGTSKIDPKASSRRAREKVRAAQASANQNTMLEIVKIHRQDRSDGKKDLPSPAPTIPMNRDEEDESIFSGGGKPSPVSHRGEGMHCDEGVDKLTSQSVPPQSSSKPPQQGSMATGDEIIEQGEANQKGRKKSRSNRKIYKVADSEPSDCSYESSNHPNAAVKELEEKNTNLMHDLNRLRKRARVAETEAHSLRFSLEKWETAFNEFSKLKPDRPLTPSKFYGTVSNWVSSTVSHSKTYGHSSPFKGLVVTETKEGKEKITPKSVNKSLLGSSLFGKSGGQTITNLVNSSTPGAKRNLFGTAEETLPEKPVSVNGNNSPQKSVAGSNKGITPKVKQSPDKPSETSPLKKKVKKSKKSPQKPALGPDEVDSKKVAGTILKVLKGEASLDTKTDKGILKVCLGNGVWIKEDIWRHRIFPEKVKLSIMTGDLVEEMYGWHKCAEMSVKGGISPKTPDAPRKQSIPAGGLEVIRGVYRAKLMYQGMVNETHLMLNLKACNDSIASKFKTCARKLSDEKKKASQSQ